jgi:hypothetical protein
MPHHWINIALGRVCLACSLAQASGEFDDDAKRPCSKDRPFEPPPAKPTQAAGPKE